MRSFKIVVTATLIVGGQTWSADSRENAIDESAEEKIEKLSKDGEKWVCLGKVLLILVGDFRGKTPETQGDGIIYLVKNPENSKGMRTFIHGLNTRTWARYRPQGKTGRVESELFVLEPSDIELLRNTPVEGNYFVGSFDPAEAEDSLIIDEHVKFDCQRFNGWKFIDQDGPYESGIPTWNGVEVEVLKLE